MRRLPAVLLAFGCAPEPVASPDALADVLTGPHYQHEIVPLPDRITGEALHGHLLALQDIADANDGHRMAGSSGYEASVAYVASVLEDAGYEVTLEPFDLTSWEEGDAPELSVAGDPVSSGFLGLRYGAAASVEGPIVGVDLMLPPGSNANDSTSACETADFDGFPVGGIALIQRGSCTFSDKVARAEAAGAIAVLIFNEGQAGRREAEYWQLSSDPSPTVPVLALDFALGEQLAGLEGQSVSVATYGQTSSVTVHNVLADTQRGDPDAILVVGGHLDSVQAGPGINDNGTGVATVLETAVQLAKYPVSLENRIRFAFWSAEELGLIGSWEHVTRTDLTPYVAYLNFDMLGSPNGGRLVYDGDGSEGGSPGPGASGQLEAFFEDWFETEGLTHAEVELGGRSDHAGFAYLGVPVAGLFSGAEEPKPQWAQDLFGGYANTAYDYCYHLECDDIANVDSELHLDMSRAVAHAVDTLSRKEGVLQGRSSTQWEPSPAGPGCSGHDHDVAPDR